LTAGVADISSSNFEVPITQVPSPRDLLTIRIHTLYTSYVNVTPSGVNAFTWAGSTTDVRALLKAASSTDRIPATWFNPPFFLIDIAFNDGLQHRAAIYCLDWDGARRAETTDSAHHRSGVTLAMKNILGIVAGV
jgi:hypothetical protein